MTKPAAVLMAALRSRISAGRPSKGRKPPRRRVAPRWLGPTLRGAGAGLALAVLLGGPTWLWRSGWFEAAAEWAYAQTLAATVQMGFAVREVLLQGRRETSREQVLAALKVKRGQPTFAFDPYRAKARLEALPWVHTASVERRLPDTVLVALMERAPMALWQRKGRLALVDRQGVIIQNHSLARFAHLPVIVGADAPAHAQALLVILGKEPALYERVEAMVRVGGRRWNLRLDNGIYVRLPEQGVDRAWARLAEAERRQRLLARDVDIIDLRIPDRLVVRIAPDARRRRAAGEDT